MGACMQGVAVGYAAMRGGETGGSGGGETVVVVVVVVRYGGVSGRGGGWSMPGLNWVGWMMLDEVWGGGQVLMMMILGDSGN